jgi:hypothetical protein
VAKKKVGFRVFQRIVAKRAGVTTKKMWFLGFFRELLQKGPAWDVFVREAIILNFSEGSK